LNALSNELDARGSRLVLRRGPSLAVLRELAKECGADAVVWSRRYEPASIARDTAVKSGLKDAGLEAESFNSALLYEPWNLKTGQGGPYRVFTPFWRASQARGSTAHAAQDSRAGSLARERIAGVAAIAASHPLGLRVARGMDPGGGRRP
jgi:deoxyribodipyrimidine photo-lyase